MRFIFDSVRQPGTMVGGWFAVRHEACPLLGPSINDVLLWGERGGVTQSVTNSTDRLRECVTKGGKGVQKNQKFESDIIYGWYLLVCMLTKGRIGISIGHRTNSLSMDSSPLAGVSVLLDI